MTENWIPRDMKKGALSRQLNIPESKNIPFQLLRKISDTPVGNRIINPTTTGKPIIKVTILLKKRAVLALTLKGMN